MLSLSLKGLPAKALFLVLAMQIFFHIKLSNKSVCFSLQLPDLFPTVPAARAAAPPTGEVGEEGRWRDRVVRDAPAGPRAKLRMGPRPGREGGATKHRVVGKRNSW